MGPKKVKIKKTSPLNKLPGTQPSHPSEAQKAANTNHVHGDAPSAAGMKALGITPMGKC
jgi:hypothetical protein